MMKDDRVCRMNVKALEGAVCFAFVMAIVSPGRAALKYDLDSYAAREDLVMHLDGIRNVGADLPHDPDAEIWANLADGNNPVKIAANASTGWRDGKGYYFCYDVTPAYAQLFQAAPAMTAATFEFAVDAGKDKQNMLDWGCTFFSAPNDQRVCTLSTGEIRFKADNWTGSSSYRPSIAGWSWKQASFALGSSGSGNFKAYDQGVLKHEVSAGNTGVNGIPATQWMIASCNGLLDSARQFTGIMRSFRIYSRALTADEVAQNAAVDAARFDGVMPVTNAVVATAVPGAFGREVPGVYAVDGTHVFTVPPSVKTGSKTYACTGCTVETWEDGIWGDPVAVDGVAVTVRESEKVRITWQWDETDGVLGAGLEAYATNGIKVWYDGIRNVGKDLPHASSPGFWCELASGKAASLTANANSYWKDDGYYFAVGPDGERSYVYLRELVSLGTVGTIEIACDTKAADQTADWARYLSFGYTSLELDSKYENKMAIQTYQQQNYLRLADDAWTGNNEADFAGTEYANWNYRANTSANWDGKHAAFVVDETGHRSYRLGARDVVKPCRTSVQEMPAAFWMIGNTFINGTAKDQLVGTMKAVRAYARVLSDEEIARHYAIDVWRFDGTVPLSNAVEVVADPRGVSGREPAGMYFPQGWTFRAFASTAGGVVYEPAGYFVETRDAATGTWRVTESSDSASVWTSPVTGSFATRRLIWKWIPVRGIRTAADYGAGDYVQGGLVGWLDGIRNAGLDRPHDDEATTWIDLSSRGSEVVLRANDRSGWRKDGYFFNIGSDGTSASYAYFKQQLSLGENGTIEIAGDIKYNEQNPTGVDNPDFVARIVAYTTGEQSGTFYDSCVRVQSNYQNNLNWNADNWSSTTWQERVNVPSPWDGCHAAFVMDVSSYSSYARGVQAETKPRNAAVTMPNLWWMVGNKYNYSNVQNQLTGTVKALRLYNRPLSAAEIAHNYKVDVARFDGQLTVTNVVVAGLFTDYEGLAAGAYEVIGSGTFTAGAATDPQGGTHPLAGYTVETWENGDWGEAETFKGNVYTYTTGTAPAKVRLTWLWNPNGTVLLLR